MPLAHPAADVWTLLADVADATPDAPAFIHGERRLSFAELLDCSARAAQGLSDLGVGPGDRVALWLPNIAGLSDPLFRLRAARRHRRRGQHALSRRRGRRHRRPLGRQGAGLRAGLPPHRLPVDPGRHRARRARPALGHRHRRRDARAGAAGHRASPARALRPPAVAPALRRQPRLGPRALQHLHDLGHDQHAQVRAAPPGRDRAATPSRSRAPSASPRPRRCRLPSCRCAACSASTRRWRRSPPASRACWSSPTRSRRSRG